MQLRINTIHGVKVCKPDQPFDVYLTKLQILTASPNPSAIELQVNQFLDYEHNDKMLWGGTVSVNDITPGQRVQMEFHHEGWERPNKARSLQPSGPQPFADISAPVVGATFEYLYVISALYGDPNMNKTISYKIRYDVLP